MHLFLKFIYFLNFTSRLSTRGIFILYNLFSTILLLREVGWDGRTNIVHTDVLLVDTFVKEQNVIIIIIIIESSSSSSWSLSSSPT